MAVLPGYDSAAPWMRSGLACAPYVTGGSGADHRAERHRRRSSPSISSTHGGRRWRPAGGQRQAVHGDLHASAIMFFRRWRLCSDSHTPTIPLDRRLGDAHRGGSRQLTERGERHMDRSKRTAVVVGIAVLLAAVATLGMYRDGLADAGHGRGNRNRGRGRGAASAQARHAPHQGSRQGGAVAGERAGAPARSRRSRTSSTAA